MYRLQRLLACHHCKRARGQSLMQNFEKTSHFTQVQAIMYKPYASSLGLVVHPGPRNRNEKRTRTHVYKHCLERLVNPVTNLYA